MRKSKTLKGMAATLVACIVMTAATPVFAATNYVNSVGSVASDYTSDVNGQNPGSADSKTDGITGYDQTQKAESQWQNQSDFAQSDTSKVYTADVYASQASGSDYYDEEGNLVDGSVLTLLPRTLILSGTADGSGEYTCTYRVQAKGNIAGNEVITITPDATVTLAQAGKDNITATITQAKQRFVVPTSLVTAASDVQKTITCTLDDTIATGTIVAKGLTAGSWHGVYNTTVSLTLAS